MPRTHKRLYHRVYKWTNLVSAFRKARRGKRSRPDVCAFEYNAEIELLALHDELRDGAYQPGEYFHFRIVDPKPRTISAAPFRDRVVHHAVCNVIEPILDRSMIHDSYACRRGKGLHAALERSSLFFSRFPYVLKTDIVRFFPSIDHELLLGLLERKIGDARLLRLLELIVRGGEDIPDSAPGPAYFPGDDLFACLRPRGLPIGNLTSQLLANYYLSPLDHFVKDELGVKGYVRYADDILCFGETKAQLGLLATAIARFLGRWRLCIHDRKTQVMPVTHGVPFLGMVIYPTHRRLRHENVQRVHRRVRRLNAAYRVGMVDAEHVRRSLMGWLGYAGSAASNGLIRSVLAEVRLTRNVNA